MVDPLDGTKEFIKRNGEFTVNIALIEGHERSLALFHVPATQVCYAAANGSAIRQSRNPAKSDYYTASYAYFYRLRIVGNSAV
ncbi:MAG: inositol monophosphatase family protein [Candidatus Competibacteraceae bacterium]